VATLALDAMVQALPAPIDALICHTRAGSEPRARDWIAQYQRRLARDVFVTSDLDAFLVECPEIVAEAAGHEALAQAAVGILAAGIDVVVSSVGALADDDLRGRLEGAAKKSGAKLLLSPGAIGGLDILGAAKLAGLSSVTYTSRKPPSAWRGTRAEGLVDLASLTQACVFFEGGAREAAQAFPQNANVAATIALTGAGLDATHVRLVADPAVSRNVHEITIHSACADVTIHIEGRPSPSNPKTSATTGYALARILLDRLERRA
jgi:aspartate dehydrogenase